MQSLAGQLRRGSLFSYIHDMKLSLAIILLALPAMASAQRTDWATWGDLPPVGERMSRAIDIRDVRRLDKIVRAKADSLVRDLDGKADVMTIRDVNGMLAIRVVLGGAGLPAEPNVTGYNAATRETLEILTKSLKGRWAQASITVDGHTDNVGPYDENMTVSFKRAMAVSGLLTRQGVDSTRITPRGYSYDYPIADNRLIEGREKNRRVELTVTLGDDAIDELWR